MTLTHGLVSAVRRDQEGITYLQTDAPMDPGVSGGAVVNMRGHVVGVPSFGLRSDAGSGLNFAVGGEEIQAMLQQQPLPSAVAGLAYAGDPHYLLPSDADIGPAWKVAPMTPGTSSGSTPAERAATASERIVSGDPVTLSSPFAELRPAVMLAQDAQRAVDVGARGAPSASRIRAFIRPDAGLDLPRLPANRRRCYGRAGVMPGGQCGSWSRSVGYARIGQARRGAACCRGDNATRSRERR